jgi:hypothetical protein
VTREKKKQNKKKNKKKVLTRAGIVRDAGLSRRSPVCPSSASDA